MPITKLSLNCHFQRHTIHWYSPSTTVAGVCVGTLLCTRDILSWGGRTEEPVSCRMAMHGLSAKITFPLICECDM